MASEPSQENGGLAPVSLTEEMEDQSAAASAGQDIDQTIHDLETKLGRLRGEHAAQGMETAEHLQALERRVHELSASICESEPDNRAEEAQAILADVWDWAELANSVQLGQAVEEAETFGRHLAEESALAWKQAVDGLGEHAGAEDCFAALMQTTTRELDVMEHEIKAVAGLEILGEVRVLLRKQLLEAIERESIDEGVLTRWATSLADSCDVMLSALPDFAPRRAAAYLKLLTDDVDWHLRSIEAQRGPRRRQLHKRFRRLRAEWQERVVQAKLEGIFGNRAVSYFERLILVLIFGVLGLLIAEAQLDLAPQTLYWMIMADTAICGVFLWEFFFKLALAPQKWLWFGRHFLIDLIPAIPFGLIGLHAADPVRAGRLGRLLRLPRLARYIRLARPVIQVYRFFVFMIRGIDRLARQYAPLLNWNVILYPTLEERRYATEAGKSRTRRLRRLRANLNARWSHLLLTTPKDQQQAVALARLEPLRSAYQKGVEWPVQKVREQAAPVQDQPVDVLLRNLAGITPQDVESELGEDLTFRLARLVSMLSTPPLCWFPLIRGCIPRRSLHMTEAEVVAAASRGLAAGLMRYHQRWLWFADLYGTVTPSQFVDRLGSLLVRSAYQPAYRLTMFGLLFIAVELMLQLTQLSMLRPLERMLYQYLGLPIIIMGAVCFLVVAAGIWLQRLAREATEFYERSVEAQFLSLTENIRSRHLQRDTAIIFQRVILPERMIAGQPSNLEQEIEDYKDKMRRWLVGDHVNSMGEAGFDVIERTALLYRDALDGAMLAESDTRTANQLLGNPALQQFQAMSDRITPRETKALRLVDMSRNTALFGGPHLWFHLITRAISHSTARLIIDYNRHAIPLTEVPHAAEVEVQRYRYWLASQHSSQVGSETSQQAASANTDLVTSAFTALHFLDDEPLRDREVAERFGEEVEQRLQRDRSLLIRRIFGTFPYHRQTRENRVLNLREWYEQWFAGGRAVLLPVFVFLNGVRQLVQLTRWLIRSVGEIRHPEKRIDPSDAAEADFVTAIRKIERMRGPVAHASVKLRARLDPEYLGIPLPGLARSTLEEVDLEADCRFLDLDRGLIKELKEEKEQTEADMQRLGQLLDQGLLARAAAHIDYAEDAFTTPEHLRATAIAYGADLFSIRPLLSCQQILKEVYRAAAQEYPLPMRILPRFKLWWMFRSYWKQHGTGNRANKKSAWRATVNNLCGVADALQVWYREGEEAQAKGERLLANLLRHPGRLSEKLVTLRTIQTLALLDVLNYREHINRLGKYEQESHLLIWGDFNKPKDEIIG